MSLILRKLAVKFEKDDFLVLRKPSESFVFLRHFRVLILRGQFHFAEGLKL